MRKTLPVALALCLGLAAAAAPIPLTKDASGVCAQYVKLTRTYGPDSSPIESQAGAQAKADSSRIQAEAYAAALIPPLQSRDNAHDEAIDALQSRDTGILELVALKQGAEAGKGLSTNDYTDTDYYALQTMWGSWTYKGYYADSEALEAAIPYGEAGWHAITIQPLAWWFWDTALSAWVETGTTAGAASWAALLGSPSDNAALVSYAAGLLSNYATTVNAALDLKANVDSLNSLDADKLATGTVNAARLPASGAAAGTYGSSTAIPVVTVDAKGRVTAATTAAVKGGHVVQADGAAMAARDNLDFGAGIAVSDAPASNATKVSLPATAYSMAFSSSDLVDSVLTVNHNLGDTGALAVTVRDGGGHMLGTPSGVTYTDSGRLSIDFSGMTLTGSCVASVIKAGGSGSSSGGMWTLVERWEPSTATDSHRFDGLDGDRDRRYLLVCNVVANGATGQYFARLNNDAGGNYSARAFDGYGDSTFENNRQTWTGICVGYTGDASYTADSAQIWARSGQPRLCQIDSLRATSGLAQEIGRFGVVWSNTADNITNITVNAPAGGNFGVGSCVELWKLAQ